MIEEEFVLERTEKGLFRIKDDVEKIEQRFGMNSSGRAPQLRDMIKSLKKGETIIIKRGKCPLCGR